MRGRTAGVVLPALAVLVLVAVVAVASTGSTPHGSDRLRAPSDSLLDTLFTLYLVAIVAGGVLLIYGLTQPRAIARELASGRYRRTSLTAWVGLALLVAGTGRFARLHLTPERGGAVEEEPPSGGGQIGHPGQKPSVQYEADISWLAVAVVAGLAVVAVGAYVVSRRRSRRARDLRDDLAEQLALPLDEVLDDLRAEADPRRAIVAAYARMERVLAANGIPRHAAETADEYLARVLHAALSPRRDHARDGRRAHVHVARRQPHPRPDPPARGARRRLDAARRPALRRSTRRPARSPLRHCRPGGRPGAARRAGPERGRASAYRLWLLEREVRRLHLESRGIGIATWRDGSSTRSWRR